MKVLKRKTLAALCAALFVVSLTACGSSEPCENCGRTPTKAYHNEYTDETEYYCSSCSSECDFCSSHEASRSDTMLGQVVFICDDCYEDYFSGN